MLGRRIAILLLIPRLIVGSDPSTFGLSARQNRKWKRDLSGLSYAYHGPHYIRLPQKFHTVIRPVNQNELSTTINVPFYKPSVKKNITRVKPNPSNIYLSSYRHNPNINVHLTDAPSLKARSPVFPSNRIPGESRLSGLYVNPDGNFRSSGDRVKSRGSAHLHAPLQKQESAYEPDVYAHPIFSNFFGESQFPVASQLIRNPIYKTRTQETIGTTAEFSVGPYNRASQYANSGKPYLRPYVPFPVEFAESNNPRAAEANVRSQGKPVYAYDFSAYDIPNVGNTHAFQVQPADFSPEQLLPLGTGHDTSQFSVFGGNNEKIKKVSSLGPYQPLSEQPQLHFDSIKNWPTVANEQPQSLFNPFDDIRTDVEVINKKKPLPPRPILPEDGDDDEPYDGSREDDEGNKDNEGHKFTSNEYSPSSADEDDYTEKHTKSKKKGKKDHDFDIYDEKFGKLSSKEKVSDKGENSKGSVDSSMFDTDVDEYLSHFYDSPLQQGHLKSKEAIVNDKQASDEKQDYRATIKQPYESSEEEFEKNHKPLINKKSTSLKVLRSIQKGKKLDETFEPMIRIRESGRGNEGQRINNLKKPYTFGERFPQEDEFITEFKDPAGKKKQPVSSYERNDGVFSRNNDF